MAKRSVMFNHLEDRISIIHGDIKEEGVEYPTGNLIVPIEDELMIYVN